MTPTPQSLDTVTLEAAARLTEGYCVCLDKCHNRQEREELEWHNSEVRKIAAAIRALAIKPTPAGEGEDAQSEAEYERNRFYGLIYALRDLPDMPPPAVLLDLDIAGKFPEDWNEGKRIQRERGLEVVPPKTECEVGAGFWNRLRTAMLAVATAPAASPVQGVDALVPIEACVNAVAMSAWKHGGVDPYSRGLDAGARHQVDESIKALRALTATPQSPSTVDERVTDEMVAAAMCVNATTAGLPFSDLVREMIRAALAAAPSAPVVGPEESQAWTRDAANEIAASFVASKFPQDVVERDIAKIIASYAPKFERDIADFNAWFDAGCPRAPVVGEDELRKAWEDLRAQAKAKPRVLHWIERFSGGLDFDEDILFDRIVEEFRAALKQGGNRG